MLANNEMQSLDIGPCNPPSFQLFNDEERLLVASASSFAERLGCLKQSKVKVRVKTEASYSWEGLKVDT